MRLKSRAARGEPLSAGHDVRALASEPELNDPALLTMAADDERVLITSNGRDFAPILREWAEAGRPHPGCILVWSFGHADFWSIVAGVDRLLAERPEQSAWSDLARAL